MSCSAPSAEFAPALAKRPATDLVDAEDVDHERDRTEVQRVCDPGHREDHRRPDRRVRRPIRVPIRAELEPRDNEGSDARERQCQRRRDDHDEASVPIEEEGGDLRERRETDRDPKLERRRGRFGRSGAGRWGLAHDRDDALSKRR